VDDLGTGDGTTAGEEGGGEDEAEGGTFLGHLWTFLEERHQCIDNLTVTWLIYSGQDDFYRLRIGATEGRAA
jgi:hypothetical protein